MSDLFDNIDQDCFESEADAFEAATYTAAELYLSMMKRLKAPTPTDQHLQEVLDFFGPFGPGRACYFAVQAVMEGRLEDDYSDIVWRVQKQCHALMKAGRVKEKGQKRDVAKAKKERAEQAGQMDIFGGELA